MFAVVLQISKKELMDFANFVAILKTELSGS